MQESVLIETDVDEHGLKPLLNVTDASFEDTANKAVRANTLDVVFFNDTLVEKGNAVLQLLAVDDEAHAAFDVAFAGE